MLLSEAPKNREIFIYRHLDVFETQVNVKAFNNYRVQKQFLP